jgi:hypothetical protein
VVDADRTESDGVGSISPVSSFGSPGILRIAKTGWRWGDANGYRPFEYPVAVSLSQSDPALLFWM